MPEGGGNVEWQSWRLNWDSGDLGLHKPRLRKTCTLCHYFYFLFLESFSFRFSIIQSSYFIAHLKCLPTRNFFQNLSTFFSPTQNIAFLTSTIYQVNLYFCLTVWLTFTAKHFDHFVWDTHLFSYWWQIHTT